MYLTKFSQFLSRRLLNEMIPPASIAKPAATDTPFRCAKIGDWNECITSSVTSNRRRQPKMTRPSHWEMKDDSEKGGDTKRQKGQQRKIKEQYYWVIKNVKGMREIGKKEGFIFPALFTYSFLVFVCLGAGRKVEMMILCEWCLGVWRLEWRS